MNKRYLIELDLLVKELLLIKQKIYISFDLWTLPSYIAFIAIFGHYVDNNGRPWIRLLTVTRVLGNHGGKNLALTIAACLKRFGLAGKIGFF